MTEQFEIVALTDVDVAYVQPTPNEGEVIVRKSITAYKRLDNGKVQEGLFELAALAAPARAQLFRISLPSDTLVRVKVAKGEQGKLWMTELPAPAKDEEMEALLAQQVAEKTVEDEHFGVFKFDRETCVTSARSTGVRRRSRSRSRTWKRPSPARSHAHSNRRPRSGSLLPVHRSRP